MRRLIGWIFIALTLVDSNAFAQPSEPDDFKVTLLGTGSPPPNLRRIRPAVLIHAGKETLPIS